jgi:glycosyltransferase involved in cell wall biosynthesis
VPFGFNLRAALSPGNEVERWLTEAAPDVVHIHHPFPLSWTAASRARRRGLPVVATNHTVPECTLWGVRNIPVAYQASAFLFGRWILRLLNQCRAVATPTETAAGALREMGYERGIRAISNGVDTDRFKPAKPSDSLRQRFGLDDRPVVLYTGRLDAEKEMDVWLRAAAIVLRSADVQLLVGGNGPERTKLEKLSRDLGIQSHVCFAGYLDDWEFAGIYSLAQVYCITSRVELQSISTLEALASGLPVVAVAAGALPEIVHDADNGFLVPPGDTVRIASALLDILEHDSLRARMGERSRNVALRHSLPQTVDAYEDFLLSAPHQA